MCLNFASLGQAMHVPEGARRDPKLGIGPAPAPALDSEVTIWRKQCLSVDGTREAPLPTSDPLATAR